MTHLSCLAMPLVLLSANSDQPSAVAGRTTLTNTAIRYTVPTEHYVRLRRGPLTAIVVDNEAMDTPELGKHRAGYNGLALLAHQRRSENLFVPGIAGLNLEHIHDGTRAVEKERFEPRRCPMQLRVIDPHTVELHQPPTANWKLESCGRYRLLDDGVIEYTFECIPRAEVFHQGTIGLFWASYVHQPEDQAIWFRGKDNHSPGLWDWIHAASPAHGVESTHAPADVSTSLVDRIDPQFPLTLVNHRSPYVYTEPWYFGVRHGMAFTQIFRAADHAWFAQSPTGGGKGNAAWDFQWFIVNARVGQVYRLVMRACYMPFSGREQLEAFVHRQREELEKGMP